MRRGALEVVEHRQQILDQILTRSLLHIGELAPGTLAKVVEVSGGAQQLVAQLGGLGLGGLQRVDCLDGCHLVGQGFRGRHF